VIRTRFSVLTLAVVLTTSLTAQGRLDRVLAPPNLPPDSRLGLPVHLNRPFKFTPAYKTADEWRTRAAALRRQVQVAVGLWPMPERTPLKPVVTGRVQRDGYTIEKIFFASAPGHYVSGNLYRPTGTPPAANGGKWPAVLSPHGHWENGRLLERPTDMARERVAAGGEKTMEGSRYPLQARLAGLAKLGVIVFMFDMVGYGDSQSIVHREGFTDIEAELRLQSVMGLQAWNALRALDFLAGLPDVDTSRSGVTGESGGGTQTFILAALDDRPAAIFPAVMVSGAMQGGCICENAPLLRIGTNNIELAALYAPKPLGMSGANDWTKDILTLGLPELKSIYRLFGAEDRVMARHFPYEHNFNQVSRELMYDWFNTHLKLGHPSPIVEPPFKPGTPAELTVYDAAHPQPADAANAATLRRTLTAASDAQLTALAATPAEYRKVVETALRVMTQEPALASVTVTPVPGTFKSLPGDGFDAHLTYLTRPGSGDAVPTMGLVPKGYKDGPMVIWAHPEGKASLFESDGRTPIPAARALLQRGTAILAPDVFLTGEFHRSGGKTTLPPVKDADRFPTYRDGYNRTILAQRTRDLLTAIAFAKTTLKPRVMHLVAVGDAGVWGLLARALAGDTITRASLDLNGFDFARVTKADDEMLLPGALKYGGVPGFLSLCTAGQTEVYGARSTSRTSTPVTPAVALRPGKASADAMANWVAGS
jgi:dienelactone hydrolase